LIHEATSTAIRSSSSRSCSGAIERGDSNHGRIQCRLGDNNLTISIASTVGSIIDIYSVVASRDIGNAVGVADNGSSGVVPRVSNRGGSIYERYRGVSIRQPWAGNTLGGSGSLRILAKLESSSARVVNRHDSLRVGESSAQDTELLDGVVGLSEDDFDTVTVYESKGTNDATISVGGQSIP